ncbi:MAG: PspC domain-containing protein [Tissierellia bacterium]|nr:PspC domain-containing protein [Tissierellia bacterium]MDD4726641.1 PspC domain-containing protein [Tissierellia bacterium]
MEKRLYRSQKDKVLAGVCGGIGEYFNIDSTIIRLLWLVSIFVFEIGVLLYIIAAVVMPKDETENYFQVEEDSSRNVSKVKSEKLFGYGLIIIGILLMLDRLKVLRWFDLKTVFPVLLIIGGIMILRKSFN